MSRWQQNRSMSRMSSRSLTLKRPKASMAVWPKCDWYNLRFILRVMFSEIMANTAIIFTLVHYNASFPHSLPIAVPAAGVFGWAVWVCGPVSGPQVTPIVPLALVIMRHITIIHALVVMIGQFLGSLFGYLLAWALRPDNHPSTHGTNYGLTVIHHVTVGQAFGLEFLAAFWVILAVLATLDEFRPSAWSQGHITSFYAFFALTILWLAALVGHYTGASIHPFRSLVPAIFGNNYKDVWIYFTAPFLGSIVAVLVYEMIMSEGASAARIKAWFTDRNFDRHLDYKKLEHEDDI
ncbi:hypothetical protein EG68_03811 [Paragonimus skrjabini miyazakii]|uniref:Aquaporin n=1 Tax=Paragonimus skrjabini miyazakii TaxID=59628 RepID=A0A8S9YX71_9TREM|nr:hypothetical protein EG68_03811 [Paragonimus skrjabini miyazakii]